MRSRGLNSAGFWAAQMWAARLDARREGAWLLEWVPGSVIFKGEAKKDHDFGGGFGPCLVDFKGKLSFWSWCQPVVGVDQKVR